jgi:hypothetical protein
MTTSTNLNLVRSIYAALARCQVFTVCLLERFTWSVVQRGTS